MGRGCSSQVLTGAPAAGAAQARRTNRGHVSAAGGGLDLWGAALAGLKNLAAAEEPIRTGYAGMKQREAVMPAPIRRS